MNTLFDRIQIARLMFTVTGCLSLALLSARVDDEPAKSRGEVRWSS